MELTADETWRLARLLCALNSRNPIELWRLCAEERLTGAALVSAGISAPEAAVNWLLQEGPEEAGTHAATRLREVTELLRLADDTSSPVAGSSEDWRIELLARAALRSRFMVIASQAPGYPAGLLSATPTADANIFDNQLAALQKELAGLLASRRAKALAESPGPESAAPLPLTLPPQPTATGTQEPAASQHAKEAASAPPPEAAASPEPAKPTVKGKRGWIPSVGKQKAAPQSAEVSAPAPAPPAEAHPAAALPPLLPTSDPEEELLLPAQEPPPAAPRAVHPVSLDRAWFRLKRASLDHVRLLWHDLPAEVAGLRVAVRSGSPPGDWSAQELGTLTRQLGRPELKTGDQLLDLGGPIPYAKIQAMVEDSRGDLVHSGEPIVIRVPWQIHYEVQTSRITASRLVLEVSEALSMPAVVGVVQERRPPASPEDGAQLLRIEERQLTPKSPFVVLLEGKKALQRTAAMYLRLFPEDPALEAWKWIELDLIPGNDGRVKK